MTIKSRKFFSLGLAGALLSILVPPVSALTPADVQKLLADDAAANDRFGFSVAVDGDTALIGAIIDDSQRGSAYVFIRSGTTWTFQAKLTALDATAGDQFGWSVSLDGDTALIGARLDDVLRGSAYVFTRSDSTWMQQAKLTANFGVAFDQFGFSVSVDGDTAVIGAPFDDGDSGSAYVFTRSSPTWTQKAQLTASDRAAGDQFGNSVSIDGDTTLIGAPKNDDAGKASSGSAYVFTRSGTSWTEQAQLPAGDAAANDQFGFSVSVAGDNALISAPFDDGLLGSAYVFTRSGITWTEQAKLTASDGAASDQFGWSVSLGGDTALISAPFDDGQRGSAYVFTRNGGTSWTQQKLTADDAAAFDQFGYSVSVAGDTALIGAPKNDDTGTNSGSAYFFSLANDIDDDGVDDNDDFCPDTLIPESVPTEKLGPNRWALTNNDFVFDTVTMGNGNGGSYTTSDTAGCSCEQIIAAQGLGKGHTKLGCSEGAMQDWIDQVN